MPQFSIINHGTLVGFLPLTEAAADWWADNVADGPQLGSTFYVEHRFAGDIICGLAEEGLV